MVPAVRAAVFAGLLGLAIPAVASPLTTLQQAARSCFESPSAVRCDGVWDLSDQLKKQADANNQLRCYTALLALEANVSKASLGRPDPIHEAQALQDTTAYCP